MRRKATRFVEGGVKVSEEQGFRRALSAYDVSGVVIQCAKTQVQFFRTLLREEGFQVERTSEQGTCTFWVRKEPQGTRHIGGAKRNH